MVHVGRSFGSLASGEVVHRHILGFPEGLQVQIMTLGATITSVRVPDVNGQVGEVTLGFDEVRPYHDGTSPYFGCVAGRVANRICRGSFVIGGTQYSLATNNGPNHLHGGVVGFDKRIWSVASYSETSLTLTLDSADGEEGYPGNVIATVKYSLPTATTLRIEYSATTDAPTPINLTNHTYWNLKATRVASHVARHPRWLGARDCIMTCRLSVLCVSWPRYRMVGRPRFLSTSSSCQQIFTYRSTIRPSRWARFGQSVAQWI